MTTTILSSRQDISRKLEDLITRTKKAKCKNTDEGLEQEKQECNPKLYLEALQRLTQTQSSFKSYLQSLGKNPSEEEIYNLQDRLIQYATALADYSSQLGIIVDSIGKQIPTIRARKLRYINDRQHSFEQYNKTKVDHENAQNELNQYKERVEKNELKLGEIGVVQAKIYDLENLTTNLGYELIRVMQDATSKDNNIRMIGYYEKGLIMTKNGGISFQDQIQNFILNCADLVEVALPTKQVNDLIGKTTSIIERSSNDMSHLMGYLSNMHQFAFNNSSVLDNKQLEFVDGMASRMEQYNNQISQQSTEAKKSMDSILSNS